MSNTNVITPNLSFSGRNHNLKQADKILRKINKDFPTTSPWHADYRAEKAQRIGENDVVAKWTNAKLRAFRAAQEVVVDKSYSKYISCLIEGLKRYKVANCKELSEIAYLIAKTNGIENGYCANLYLKNPKNKKIDDVDHTIFIINPNQPKRVGYGDPYYDEEPCAKDLFVPDKKSIVVDPLFGFVDYWQNVSKIYENNELLNLDSGDYLSVFLRKPLFKNEKDVHNVQSQYPILSMNKNNQNCRSKYDFRVSDIALEMYKTSAKNLVIKNYPSAQKEIKISDKKEALMDKILKFLS